MTGLFLGASFIISTVGINGSLTSTSFWARWWGWWCWWGWRGEISEEEWRPGVFWVTITTSWSPTIERHVILKKNKKKKYKKAKKMNKILRRYTLRTVEASEPNGFSACLSKHKQTWASVYHGGSFALRPPSLLPLDMLFASRYKYSRFFSTNVLSTQKLLL